MHIYEDNVESKSHHRIANDEHRNMCTGEIIRYEDLEKFLFNFRSI